MKKISLIVPVNDFNRINETASSFVELFKGRYDFEVICLFSEEPPKNLITDYRYNFMKLETKLDFNEMVTMGFEKATGDAIVLVDLSNHNYLDYIIKLIAEWENKAQIVLIKKNRNESSFWGKICKFFRKMKNKFYEYILLLFGLNKDFGAYRTFQLFSKDVADVIKSLPQKNKYLRNFECWIDYRVSVLYANEPIKVKENVNICTPHFYLSLTSLLLTFIVILTIVLGVGGVAGPSRASFILIGSCIALFLFGYFIFCATHLFVYLKTGIKCKFK